MQLDLVLVGFGSVARRFVRLLREREASLTRDYDLTTRIVAIATARHGCLVDPSGIDAVRAADLVAAGKPLSEVGTSAGTAAADTLEVIARTAGGGATVMIETTVLDIETGEPAASHIRAAFEKGQHVITANKGPIACAYRELRGLAARCGVEFFFEGTVLDGIPVFNLVRETLPTVRVTGFRGVVNTTANFALEAMEGGQELAQAVADMQRQGIAEADPSMDIDGWDAAAKAAALVNVLMDGDMRPTDVRRTGIRGLTAAQVRDARAAGRRYKLVSSAWTEGGVLRAEVTPEALPLEDSLAQLRGLDNALVLKTDLLGEIVITERDGGLTETAFALLTDLVAVRRRLGAPPGAPARRTP
jgi:homoserine dehydrogenase